MDEREGPARDHNWFGPLRFGPPNGIVTQALGIVGAAAIAATLQATFTPEDKIWLDALEGFVATTEP